MTKRKHKKILPKEEVAKIFKELKLGSAKPYLPEPDFSLEEMEKITPEQK